MNKGHIILNGNKKVMFSAPHAVEQTRENRIKFAEPDTGNLAQLLNSLGYPCIIKTKNMNDDANFDINCAYKQDLVRFINNNNISALIDLHEMAPTREQLICLGSGGETCLNLLGNHKKEQALREYFNAFFNNISINIPFEAKGDGTIARFISKTCKIPCIQIEMNCKLFMDNIINSQDMCKILDKCTKIMEKEIDEKDIID